MTRDDGGGGGHRRGRRGMARHNEALDDDAQVTLSTVSGGSGGSGSVHGGARRRLRGSISERRSALGAAKRERGRGVRHGRDGGVRHGHSAAAADAAPTGTTATGPAGPARGSYRVGLRRWWAQLLGLLAASGPASGCRPVELIFLFFNAQRWKL
ncbi:hypothetical protein U9M48_000870 [Paspalum notatum var. saurae]|uniref:Uncharacterized protein n=1 Tax=Paspalum notatum var. saurae TaxID=547442 RepID=A0AAQ3PMA9_PASNO